MSQGSKVTLIMNLMKFEFDEGCPNDYIEVRDGGLSSSPLIGRYCRSPPSMHVTSSTNGLYVTYKSDASYASHFKLFYTASDGPAIGK